MGETQIELQATEDEPVPQQEASSLLQTASQEPPSFPDVVEAAGEMMEAISDDEGSLTRGGSGLEDEEGRQDVTGPQR